MPVLFRPLQILNPAPNIIVTNYLFDNYHESPQLEPT
jgi:hypothetical protein